MGGGLLQRRRALGRDPRWDERHSRTIRTQGSRPGTANGGTAARNGSKPFHWWLSVRDKSFGIGKNCSIAVRDQWHYFLEEIRYNSEHNLSFGMLRIVRSLFEINRDNYSNNFLGRKNIAITFWFKLTIIVQSYWRQQLKFPLKAHSYYLHAVNCRLCNRKFTISAVTHNKEIVMDLHAGVRAHEHWWPQ